jgi:5-oxoprolinase (ATP-hydrolysing) subunit B
MPTSYPRLLTCGDSALVVEFGNSIDPELNRRVLAFDALIAQEKVTGVRETVPTYRSLLVHYDPTVVGYAELGGKLMDFATRKGLPSRRAGTGAFPWSMAESSASTSRRSRSGPSSRPRR